MKLASQVKVLALRLSLRSNLVVIFYHYLRFMFQTYFYFTEETDDLTSLQ